MRHVLLAGLAALCTPLALRAQQPTAPARDTVVVLRRDTVVVIRRDTVFLQVPAGADDRRLPPGRGGYDGRGSGDVPASAETPEERRARLIEAREERVARLRELREERQAYFDALPPVRTSEHAFAVVAYPTRLLELEFPSLSLGVSYVRGGQTGVMASFGLLTVPNSGRGSGTAGATSRGPVRGFDLGLEGRYYVSPLRDNFPMYLGLGANYSLALVTFDRFVPNADFTYSRLQSADAQGRRLRGTAFVGWELRSRGLALDLTTGLEVGGRGIFTSDPGLVREIDRNFWNVNRANTYNLLVLPIMRVGIGVGKW